MVCDRVLSAYSLEVEAGVLLVKHQDGKYKHTSMRRGMWRWKGGGTLATVKSGFCFESAQEAAIAASQEAFYKDDVARLQSRGVREFASDWRHGARRVHCRCQASQRR